MNSETLSAIHDVEVEADNALGNAERANFLAKAKCDNRAEVRQALEWTYEQSTSAARKAKTALKLLLN